MLMQTQHRSILAAGYTRLGEAPKPPTPEPAAMSPQKPAKPQKAKRTQTEDYSTDYVPPMPTDGAAVATGDSTPKNIIVAVDGDLSLEITNDPLPGKRAAIPHKYHAVFDRMATGQSLRVPEDFVGRVAVALRKYIELKNKKANVKSCLRFKDKNGVEDTGFGRVWMLDGAAKPMAKRAK